MERYIFQCLPFRSKVTEDVITGWRLLFVYNESRPDYHPGKLTPVKSNNNFCPIYDRNSIWTIHISTGIFFPNLLVEVVNWRFTAEPATVVAATFWSYATSKFFIALWLWKCSRYRKYNYEKDGVWNKPTEITSNSMIWESFLFFRINKLL